MGKPESGIVRENATQTSFSYTSTRSTFVFDVGEGKIELTAEFLSPVSDLDDCLACLPLLTRTFIQITPHDLMRSSLPYTYLNVVARSLDGHHHHVQLYTYISAEWVSGDRSATAEWSYGVITPEISPRGLESSDAAKESALRAPSRRRLTQTKHDDSARRATLEASSSQNVAFHRVFRQQQLPFAEIDEQAEWGH